MSHAPSSVKKAKKPRQKDHLSNGKRVYQRKHANPPNPAPYNYQPLDATKSQIRLLKLHKDKDGPVRCDVDTFTLEHAPSYCALSYMWGPPPTTHQLLADGQVIEIRENLHDCLLELRDEDEGYLWIDQICINQSDVNERSSQVRLLADIYTRAESVIVWLSDRTGEISDAARSFNDPVFDPSSVEVFMDNPYFRRVWILQEITLAKHIRIFCKGHTWVSEKTLYGVLNFWWDGMDECTTAHISVLRLFTERRKNKKLDYVLTLYRESLCHDPRDTVYGLMGIVKESERVVVDYNKTVHEVISDVALLLCASWEGMGWNELWYFNDHTLEILCQKMGIPKCDLMGLRSCYAAISGQRQTTFEYHECSWVVPAPIVAVGYQPARESGRALGRWWYELSTGTRYYHDCGSEDDVTRRDGYTD